MTVVVDRDRWCVVIDGRRIPLPRKKFLMVALLSHRPGVVRTAAELAEAAEIDAPDCIGAVRTAVKWLRNQGIPIETRYDIGYAWPE